MIYRRNRNQKNLKNKNLLISIISLFIVLVLSLVIANNLALAIYKNSNHLMVEEKEIKKEKSMEIEEEKKYVNNLMNDSLILFQGGVFTDLENAEDFKKNINNKVLATIVNDGKYERIIVGISNKDNFLDFVNIFKKNNIQFIKQVYNIPMNVKYNSEILDIINLFTNFILKEVNGLTKGEFDISNFKNEVEDIKPYYGNVGSYKKFNELKELILDFDSKVSREELESVIEFIYFSFREYMK